MSAVAAVTRRVRAKTERWNVFQAGASNLLANYLDRAASRRVLQALIRRTNDVDTVRWLGRQTWQYPLDAWVIQEAISELRPDIIVETGTHRGGSAFFYASLFDLLGHGEVVTIDIDAKETIPHPRITYLTGSSTDSALISEVEARIGSIEGKRALVILDSDHSQEHVAAELEAYAPLVPVGSYIHVQDGCIDELPVFGKHKGPKRAAQGFLEVHPEFERDTQLERRYVMTAHPYGWLRRTRTTDADSS